MDLEEPIRFRVETLIFVDVGPVHGDDKDGVKVREPPFKILVHSS